MHTTIIRCYWRPLAYADAQCFTAFDALPIQRFDLLGCHWFFRVTTVFVSARTVVESQANSQRPAGNHVRYIFSQLFHKRFDLHHKRDRGNIHLEIADVGRTRRPHALRIRTFTIEGHRPNRKQRRNVRSTGVPIREELDPVRPDGYPNVRERYRNAAYAGELFECRFHSVCGGHINGNHNIVVWYKKSALVCLRDFALAHYLYRIEANTVSGVIDHMSCEYLFREMFYNGLCTRSLDAVFRAAKTMISVWVVWVWVLANNVNANVAPQPHGENC